MTFINDIAKLTGLPLEMLAGGYRYLNFCGNAVYIEGIKGVVSVAEARVSVRAGKHILAVYGEGLTVKELTADDIIITGKITQVNLEG